VAFFAFVMIYLGHGEALKRTTFLILSIVPILTLMFMWVAPLQGLFYGSNPPSGSSMIFSGGPWFYIFVIYSYGLMMVGVVLLARAYLNSPAFYQRQTRLILVGALLPWVTNILMLTGWKPLPGLDVTPIAFTVTGLLFAYAIFGYRLMDLVPVARDALVENMDEGIVVIDLQARVVDINSRALMLASSRESPIGRPLGEVFSYWKNLIEEHSAPNAHFQMQLPEPPYSHLDVRLLPLSDKHGHYLGHLVIWRDVTEQAKVEENLRIFRHTMEQSPSAIIITDSEGHIEYVNRHFTAITGYTFEDVRGKTPRIMKSGETSKGVYEQLWNTIKRGETWTGELLNRKKDGDSYWAQQLIAPVTDPSGHVIRFVAMQQDITERKHAEAELRIMNTRLQVQLMEIEHLHEQLREEAIRDSLTRLFNRRYMEESLEREISRTDRDPWPISVVMMDVDLFKTINDTYGHQAGDTVLQTLGTFLLENTRISDIACRYGGDEMVVVMPGASMEAAAHRAEEWRSAFSLLEFSLGDVLVKTTLSFGIATFPTHAKSPNELLGAADRALYRAKIRRNCAEIYEETMNNHHPVTEKEH
jgi:diguanylate cyclase (GGDEF)-like protein/PAS domain S-box-containing protein